MLVVDKSECSSLKRKIHAVPLAAIVVALAFGTASCSSVSKSLGGGKNSPDEFAVVTKAPLVIPPDFSLRPPKPGARRPQERNAEQEAANTVFGEGSSAASVAQTDGERVLLTSAGAQDADNSIRDLIDSEYFTIQRTNTGFANKILFWQGETVDPATLVDAEAEAERLRKNQDLGQPATDGDTPTTD